MKICTDASIFGAWINQLMCAEDISNALDVGSGTGLLSVMLAQESKIHIDAVELDEQSFDQTKSNFSSSGWSDRLQAFHNNVFDFQTQKKYDLLISNPPFFSGDLRPADPRRRRAMHDEEDFLKRLLVKADVLLNKPGFLALLMPYRRKTETLIEVRDKGLHLKEILNVKRNTGDEGFRVMYLFSTEEQDQTKEKELIIRMVDGNYTPEFISLLKPYYLKL